MKKLVILAIEANGRYCDKACPWLTDNKPHEGNACTLFGKALDRDYRRPKDSRLAECRKAEVKT